MGKPAIKVCEKLKKGLLIYELKRATISIVALIHFGFSIIN